MRKKICQIPRRRWVIALLFGFAAFGASDAGTAGKPEPGLSLTMAALHGDKAADATVSPNAWLYVPAGEPPTPFLSGGTFSADWTGFVSSEIRDNYRFQAELSGDLKLEINGAVVLEARGKATNTEPSKLVRLNKGTNAFKLHFVSPSEGDAFVRLYWSGKEFPPEPIALGALSHGVTPELEKANQLRFGRELFVESRCAKCHAGPGSGAGIPELSMDAPSFEGIGSRRNSEWMTRWIADPRALRPTAHMPKLLGGPKAKADAEAIAAFLTSLKADTAPRETKEPGAGEAETGKKLFDALLCVACHNTPGTSENDPQKIPLNHVREKFAPGGLVAFLRQPAEHYDWIRMPDFKLTADEVAHLADFLRASAERPKDAPLQTDSAAIERGKRLVQISGCLNCHALRIENVFKAVSLAELTPDKWTRGCLAEKPDEDSKAPRFSFTASEREALRAFGATDRASLARHAPVEFAERQARILRCAECHGKFEGFPPLEGLGGKLKPEWMAAFISGELAYKPRPWIESRMPAFPATAGWLAAGLAEQQGCPPVTPAEPPIDQQAVPVGRKLVSANGGFFCVSCHAVGSVAAMQAFESNGVNLAYSGARLQKTYCHRWVRNPQRIDPATKMPVYFDADGKSPLTDFYNGDADKQIEAIWQYIRLGDKMPSPEN